MNPRRWVPKEKRGGHTPIPDGLKRNDPMSLAVLGDRYLEDLGVHNFSVHTVNHHRACLFYALGWMAERDIHRPHEVTPAILESYQRQVYRHQKKDGKPLGFTTQRYRLSVVRQFFRWLCRKRIIEMNPAAEIELPKKEKRLPKLTLSSEEMEKILAMPNVNEAQGLRDRAILETFYSTGMRRLELCQLQTSDLDIHRRVIFIRQGKGHKDRVVPIGRRALGWVERYIEHARPRLIHDHQEKTLFLSVHGGTLHRDHVSQMSRRYIGEAIPGRVGSCHLFRHTVATLMLENGADVRYLQEMLGHAQLSTTQLYTQVSIAQLQKVHELTHPAEQKTDPQPTT